MLTVLAPVQLTELRTPVHGILAMTQELLNGNLGEREREEAGLLSSCAEHLLSLVNDVLDFEKV